MSEKHIKTFAVLDLETNDFPIEHTCFITELSIYAFSEKCLQDEYDDPNLSVIKTAIEGVQMFKNQPPELPRVLNKLTLMINPIKFICPKAVEISGLSNDMLCHEAPFNKNTADCLLLFLERLEKPICLVAHNGWSFDFPVIRHALEKINMILPSSIFCIDSMKAFREFDEKHLQMEKITKVLPVIADMENDNNDKCFLEVNNEIVVSAITGDLERNTQFKRNEAVKRKFYDSFENTISNTIKCQNTDNSILPKLNTVNAEASSSSSFSSQNSISPTQKRLASLRLRRSLFSDNFSPKTKYPKKGTYVLGNIYERIFGVPAESLHRAESDVAILTKLILHYGLNFLAYAEERKQLFRNVPKL